MSQSARRPKRAYRSDRAASAAVAGGSGGRGGGGGSGSSLGAALLEQTTTARRVPVRPGSGKRSRGANTSINGGASALARAVEDSEDDDFAD